MKLFSIRLLLLGFVIISFLLGGWAALQRAGWQLPTIRSTLTGIHGVLMIGVFATLISLERAVAISAMFNQIWHWAYSAPLLFALGVFVLIFWGAQPIAKLSLLLGGILLWWAYVYTATKRCYWSFHVYILVWATSLLVIGNGAWVLSAPIFAVVHLWTAFLVVTIISERLELSRVRRLTPLAERVLLIALTIYSLGALFSLANLGVGIRILGIGMIALAVWLFKYDIAGRGIHQSGFTRYIAWCMLIGYAWLGIGGFIAICVGAVYAGFEYDMLIHAVVVGFVFSMIFGHAPLIFPALTGHEIRFTSFFYGCLIILHIAVIMRISGDVAMNFDVRMWASMINAVAVLLFLGLILSHLRRHS
jgi:hypothetical protein